MTRKLRKLWTKYSEAKGELDGAWGEWAGEKEEMLDSVRMLQQQLLLKDLVIQAFIPPQDVHKVHYPACCLPCLPTVYPAGFLLCINMMQGCTKGRPDCLCQANYLTACPLATG